MAINRAVGPARPGTTFEYAKGCHAVVTHLMDKRGCDVQDPAQAVTAVIYTADGSFCIALRACDRKKIDLAAGSA